MIYFKNVFVYYTKQGWKIESEKEGALSTGSSYFHIPSTLTIIGLYI